MTWSQNGSLLTRSRHFSSGTAADLSLVAAVEATPAYILSATRSPKSPVGLMISTVIRIPNTNTSCHRLEK